MSFHGAGHTMLRRPKPSARRIGLLDKRSLTLFENKSRKTPIWVGSTLKSLPLPHRIVEVESCHELPPELADSELPILQHGPETICGGENIAVYVGRLKGLVESERLFLDDAKDPGK